MTDLEFYAAHNGAYPYVPHKSVVDEYSRSNYISLPTGFYDQALGQKTTQDWVDVVVSCERLGFDGIVVSEQHNGPIGVTPAVMVTAAMLAAKTERILIAAVGPILNAYLSPVRLAEEVTLVDQYSNGRLILGLPMGTGGQYHSYGVTDPTVARERFREAHDLLIRAMTDPGPFSFEGDFYNVPYVNLWPRPIQKPHPPIFVPGAGSRETLELAAKFHYVYQAVLAPRKNLLKNIALFRELCAEEGYEPEPEQIALVVFVHTAETDEQARIEAEAHVSFSMQNLFRNTFQDAFAPGHVTEKSLQGMLGGGYRAKDISDMDWDDLVEEGWLVAGSPDTVAEKLEKITSELGAGRVIMLIDHATMPRWMIEKSITMFAEQVMPRFRPPGGKPVWARGEDTRQLTTASEIAATSGGPRAIAAARMPDGSIIDTQTAHLVEQRTPLDPDQLRAANRPV